MALLSSSKLSKFCIGIRLETPKLAAGSFSKKSNIFRVERRYQVGRHLNESLNELFKIERVLIQQALSSVGSRAHFFNTCTTATSRIRILTSLKNT